MHLSSLSAIPWLFKNCNSTKIRGVNSEICVFLFWMEIIPLNNCKIHLNDFCTLCNIKIIFTWLSEIWPCCLGNKHVAWLLTLIHLIYINVIAIDIVYLQYVYGNVSCLQLPIEIRMNTERKCINKKNNQLWLYCKCAFSEHYYCIRSAMNDRTQHPHNQQITNE